MSVYTTYECCWLELLTIFYLLAYTCPCVKKGGLVQVVVTTGAAPSPSVKSTRGRPKTLGEGFPECNTRGRNSFFLNLFPECNTRGRISFFRKPLPRVPVHRHSRKHPGLFFKWPSPSAKCPALGEAPWSFLKKMVFPEFQMPRNSGKPPALF
jgi:hypothetical protein